MAELEAHYRDAYLAHYGVVGMTWGKRSGGGVTARAKGSALDRNARKTRYAKTAQKVFAKPKTGNRAVANAVIFGVAGVGPGRALIKKVADVRVSHLTKQKAKIESGNRKVRNLMGTSAAGLFVSVRPTNS